MKKKKVILGACIAFAVLLLFGGIYLSHETPEKTGDLRAKYPLIRETEYIFDDPGFSFEDRIAIAPNIAEIQVVRQLPDYSVVVEDGAYGNSKEIVFCQYEVKLVSDIGGTDIVTDENDTFVLVFAKNFAGSYPTLDDGMQAICSIEAASGVHEGKYILFDRSFYFVDSQMALAAYEGDDSPAKVMCSRDTLVQKIRSIKNEK